MLAAYIALVTTLNLCLGYALGVRFGALPGLEFLRAPDAVAGDEPSLHVVSKVAKAKPRPQPTAKSKPAAKPAREPLPEFELPAEVAAQGDEAPPAESVLASLAEFRARLATVQTTTKTATDVKQLQSCASDLESANHDYVEEASRAIQQLEVSQDEQDLALCQTLREQTEQVEQVVAGLAECDRSDKNTLREKLTETTDQLATASQAVAQELTTAGLDVSAAYEAAGVDLHHLDPTSGLATIEHVLKVVAEELSSSGGAPLQIGCIQLETDEATASDEVRMSRLVTGLADMVQQQLTRDQLAAIDEDGRLLLTLAGDTAEAATARLETVRQLVDTATITCDGEPLQVKVSCALTDSLASQELDDTLQWLNEGLAEAARYGGNRTLHHDGKLPMPVLPRAGKVEAIAIEV